MLFRSKSFVAIKGSSNINQFMFINTEPIINNDTGNRNEQNYINIPVYAFHTSNNRMIKDFHNMLKAEQYPYIQIRIEAKRWADFDEGSGLTRFKSEITIAGKSNEYVIPSEISTCENGSGYMLKGNLSINLTDFDIDPPSKVLGAVKVNNEVFINFVFKLESEGFLTEDIP